MFLHSHFGLDILSFFLNSENISTFFRIFIKFKFCALITEKRILKQEGFLESVVTSFYVILFKYNSERQVKTSFFSRGEQYLTLYFEVILLFLTEVAPKKRASRSSTAMIEAIQIIIVFSRPRTA